MQKSFLTATLLFATLLWLTGCGFDCIEKKTGIRKSSKSMKEAQENGLFIFEFVADKASFQLESGLVFTIKNAWVENKWRYECLNNNAELVKDSSFQFVIDADYGGKAIHSDYRLGNSYLGAILDFDYSGQDTFRLNINKDTSYTLTHNTKLVDKINFVKRQAKAENLE